MAKISETELQRRLKSLEKKTAFSLKIVISDIDPVGTDHAEGSEHYNSTTGNLYIFSNGAWELTATKLHIMYATVVTNLSEEGIAPSQGDVTGFSELPYTAGGLQKDYRGLWFGGRTASTDSTDYIWTLTAGESGAVPTYERYYSNTAGLASEMGDPTNPGSGITWILTAGSAPSTAYWVAERYTIDGVVSGWQVYPVQAKDGGIPFVTYTKAGFNMPILGDSTWIADTIDAVTVFTGRVYTSQKEFGYGTTVVITYDNGKLYGTYRRSGSTDTWEAPASFIDGDLIVDGTIAAEHIQATSIDATKLIITGGNAITYNTVGADAAGAASAAQLAAIDAAAIASQADADLAETSANAYADGIVTVEEARAILDATTKADAARAAAEAASDVLGSAAAAQVAAISAAAIAAQTKADLAQVTAEAYADGIVTVEEARAILDATTKANAAQAAAEAASDVLGSAAAAQVAAINAAALASQADADLAETAANAYADGIVTVEEARAILDATTKANAAQAAAEAASDAAVAVVTDNIYTTATTTIDGGKITTGSVTATQITATSLSAITADLGTITTGKLENTDSSFVIDLTNKTMYIR